MKVHILGGGIGGMSCALHLARLVQQGVLPAQLEVHIHEASDRLGGKAASQMTDRGDGSAWPGEHGFRFFPGFYRNIVDTLRYIPITAAQVQRRHLRPELIGMSVRDLIKSAPEAGFAFEGIHPISRASSLDAVIDSTRALLSTVPGAIGDLSRFASEILHFLTACEERALERWEPRSLQDLIDERGFGGDMQAFLRSLRALSAMRANRGSLRTLLFTAVQMVADFDPDHTGDGLLYGPTDYLMLEPWEQELRRLGLDGRIHFGRRLAGLVFRAPVTGVPASLARVVFDDGATIDLASDDFVVLAVPYEVASRVLNQAENLPAPFTRIREIPQSEDNLGTGAEPMVGIQYWLKRDVPALAGHVIYPRVDWAMTSISQGQFWKQTFDRPLAEVFQAHGLRDVLSVIVSGWDVRSTRLGKAPMTCDEAELAREAFDQVAGEHDDLQWSDVIGWHVDSDIQFSAGKAFCSTPLWVSPKGSYQARPLPDPGCRNIFIASDWARTETDIGSMESADEAARVSVRAIARRLGVPLDEPRLPRLPPLRLWRSVELARKVDRWLFKHKLPQVMDLSRTLRVSMQHILAKLLESPDDEFMWNKLAIPSIMKGKVPSETVRRSEVETAKRILDAFERAGWEAGAAADVAALDALARELSAVD